MKHENDAIEARRRRAAQKGCKRLVKEIQSEPTVTASDDGESSVSGPTVAEIRASFSREGLTTAASGSSPGEEVLHNFLFDLAEQCGLVNWGAKERCVLLGRPPSSSPGATFD